MKNTFLSARDEEKEIPQLKKLRPRVTPEAILRGVREELGCKGEQILEKGQNRNRAHEIAIYLSRALAGYPVKI